VPNLKWRSELLAAADDVGVGAHSVLERHYLVDVERAHRLPIGERQRVVGDTHQDVLYREYRTTAELDGRLHRPVEASWRDMRRDNAAAVRGEMTLRYGWADVRHRSCAVAAEVGTVLRARGWPGKPIPCGPKCAVAAVA
jgi:very-short-patch-repair endonuclease